MAIYWQRVDLYETCIPTLLFYKNFLEISKSVNGVMKSGSWKESMTYQLDKPFNNVNGPSLSRIHRTLGDVSVLDVAVIILVISFILKQAKAGLDCSFGPIFLV